ncbi:MaoC family dehydratase [Amycolatopsis sp. cg5]|uniref:MaoC family dehydratase n=1 Tax=Amycolatopsis sp. cg5 TaxID=3238802 RepID=UPI003526C1E7
MTASARSQEMKYFEDLVGAPVRKFGPLVFTTVLLDQLLDLMGEKHPVHDSDSFANSTERKQRIVPGGFIHSITSGWTVQHGSPAAIVGMRSVHWDFVRPLYPDTPFYFTTKTESTEPLSEKAGLVNTVRRVFDEDGKVLAIGRMSVVMLRKTLTSQGELS